VVDDAADGVAPKCEVQWSETGAHVRVAVISADGSTWSVALPKVGEGEGRRRERPCVARARPPAPLSFPSLIGRLPGRPPRHLLRPPLRAGGRATVRGGDRACGRAVVGDLLRPRAGRQGHLVRVQARCGREILGRHRRRVLRGRRRHGRRPAGRAPGPLRPARALLAQGLPRVRLGECHRPVPVARLLAEWESAGGRRVRRGARPRRGRRRRLALDPRADPARSFWLLLRRGHGRLRGRAALRRGCGPCARHRRPCLLPRLRAPHRPRRHRARG
jgi:hypothetical protein